MIDIKKLIRLIGPEGQSWFKTPENLKLYHGTGWKFAPTENNPYGEFDITGKLKTGEGALAYGPGAYLTGHEPLGESYARNIYRKLRGYQGDDSSGIFRGQKLVYPEMAPLRDYQKEFESITGKSLSEVENRVSGKKSLANALEIGRWLEGGLTQASRMPLLRTRDVPAGAVQNTPANVNDYLGRFSEISNRNLKATGAVLEPERYKKEFGNRAPASYLNSQQVAFPLDPNVPTRNTVRMHGAVPFWLGETKGTEDYRAMLRYLQARSVHKATKASNGKPDEVMPKRTIGSVEPLVDGSSPFARSVYEVEVPKGPLSMMSYDFPLYANSPETLDRLRWIASAAGMQRPLNTAYKGKEFVNEMTKRLGPQGYIDTAKDAGMPAHYFLRGGFRDQIKDRPTEFKPDDYNFVFQDPDLLNITRRRGFRKGGRIKKLPAPCPICKKKGCGC